MNKVVSLAGAFLLSATASTVVFAQATSNTTAPQPNSSGSGVIQPTTKNGVTVDRQVSGTNAASARPVGGETGNSANSMSGPNASSTTGAAGSAGGSGSGGAGSGGGASGGAGGGSGN